MALDDLVAVVKRLRDEIETRRRYLSEQETRTRQVLIDPLLGALGWDVSDPEHVELEYSDGDERTGYALMSEGRMVAVVEAKKWGAGLDARETMQLGTMRTLAAFLT